MGRVSDTQRAAPHTAPATPPPHTPRPSSRCYLRYSPEIIEKNGLKDIIGYDNLCVGFDAPPARYVAVPMQVMMAVLACRYSSLDTTRAALEFTHGNITRSQYWCSYIANTVYAGFLCCFPMLLVLTPDLSSGIRDVHTYAT